MNDKTSDALDLDRLEQAQLEHLAAVKDLDPLHSSHIISPGFTHMANLTERIEDGGKGGRGRFIAMIPREWADWIAAIDNAAPALFARARRAEELEGEADVIKEAIHSFSQRAEAAERQLQEKDAEIARLKAEVAQLKTAIDPDYEKYSVSSSIGVAEGLRADREDYMDALRECYGEGMGDGCEETLACGIRSLKRLAEQGVALRTVFGESVWNLSDEETHNFCRDLATLKDRVTALMAENATQRAALAAYDERWSGEQDRLAAANKRVVELEWQVRDIAGTFIADCARMVGLPIDALPDAVMNKLTAMAGELEEARRSIEMLGVIRSAARAVVTGMKDGTTILANVKPGQTLTEEDKAAIAEWVEYVRAGRPKKRKPRVDTDSRGSE